MASTAGNASCMKITCLYYERPCPCHSQEHPKSKSCYWEVKSWMPLKDPKKVTFIKVWWWPRCLYYTVQWLLVHSMSSANSISYLLWQVIHLIKKKKKKEKYHSVFKHPTNIQLNIFLHKFHRLTSLYLRKKIAFLNPVFDFLCYGLNPIA